MNILDQIIKHKTNEVAKLKQSIILPFSDPVDQPNIRRFDLTIKKDGPINFITEFKRASPSKGMIRKDADPSAIGVTYAAHGAAAISVLTDSKFFHGSEEDLLAIRQSVSVPVLRKEFIIDEYQIHETAEMGADALLLIVAALDDGRLKSFHRIADIYGLHCLVEVHNEAELHRALNADSRIIGINNRDLTNFTVNLSTSLNLIRKIPNDVITISESGIITRSDVLLLEEAGFDAILVGESLMRASNIGEHLDILMG